MQACATLTVLGGLKSYDLWRLDQLNDHVGDYTIARAAEAWSEFEKKRCGGLAPATVDRFRSVLQAAINYTAKKEQFVAPKVERSARIQNKRIRYLSPDQQERL